MAGSGHGARAGEVGPVEPGSGTSDAGDTRSSAPRTRVGRRWNTLSRRQRGRILTLGTLVLATAFTALAVAGPFRHPRATPDDTAGSEPPYPSWVSDVTYLGPGHPAEPGQHGFSLRIKVSVVRGKLPMEVVDVRQEYTGVTTAVRGGTPVTVGPGHPIELDIEYQVQNCAATPLDAGLPYLNVTLRNTRAIQTLSQILGDRYARDLSINLHTTCPPSAIRTARTEQTDPDD